MRAAWYRARKIFYGEAEFVYREIIISQPRPGKDGGCESREAASVGEYAALHHQRFVCKPPDQIELYKNRILADTTVKSEIFAGNPARYRPLPPASFFQSHPTHLVLAPD